MKRPNMNTPAAPYIAQIDGLRALAISWVVAFHYFPQWFSGGYIGVDVFFVISGYLISGIIWKQLGNHAFSFADFYGRRIRRIFPALITVLVASLMLGFCLLHNQEYRQLVKHVFAASLFLNNWALSIEKGYFDVDSEGKPLLHLWSLSIEEQFYLVWPLLLWWLSRCFRQKKHLALVLAALAGASLLACLLQTPARPVGAFYSPHTRIWELILGGLLHVLPSAWIKALGRWHGAAIVMLFLALFLLSPQHPFPGPWALLPTLAGALLICAPPSSSTARILALRPLVALGQISYPLYLWHWPLLSFALLYFDAALNWAARLGLLAISVLLAWITKIGIEDRMRFGDHGGRKTKALVLGMVVISALSIWVYNARGLPWRPFNALNISLSTGDIDAGQKTTRHHCPFIADPTMVCWSDHADTPRHVVLGDSKGKAVFFGLTHLDAPQAGWFYLGGNADEGAPVPQLKDGASSVQNAMDRALELIDGLPSVGHVVLAVATRTLYGLARDDSVLDLATRSPEQQQQVQDAVYQALFKLGQNHRQVDVLLDNPTFWHPTRCVGRKTGWPFLDAYVDDAKQGCGMSLDTHLERVKIYRNMMYTVQAQLAKQNLNIRIIDTLSALCDLDQRRCDMVKNGRYLYDFTDHTSGYGSVLVAQIILQARQSQPGPTK